MQKYRLKVAARYFALALGLSWLFTIPLALSGASMGGSLVVNVGFALGGLGPAFSAVILLYSSVDRDERKRYWRRLSDVSRIKPKWLIIVLGLVPAITVISALVDRLLGGWGWRPDALAEFSGQPLSAVPFILFILLFGPLPEELGWRGFGLDQLLRARWPDWAVRWRFTIASLLVGVVWASWHLPLYFVEGTYQSNLLSSGWPLWSYVGGQLISSVLYTWLFINTDHSTSAAILFHFTQNFTGELLTLSPGAELIFFALYVLIAGAIVIRAGNADERAVAIIVVVAVGNDHVEPVGAAAQKDADQRVAGGTDVGVGQADAGHPTRQGHQPVTKQQPRRRLHAAR